MAIIKLTSISQLLNILGDKIFENSDTKNYLSLIMTTFLGILILYGIIFSGIENLWKENLYKALKIKQKKIKNKYFKNRKPNKV